MTGEASNANEFVPALRDDPRIIATQLANLSATRVRDVDTWFVIPVDELPDLGTGTTSPTTGEHTPSPPLNVFETPPVRPAEVVPYITTPTTDLPSAFKLLASFPVFQITGGKFQRNGDLLLTARIPQRFVRQALPVWEGRHGFILHFHVWGIDPRDISSWDDTYDDTADPDGD